MGTKQSICSSNCSIVVFVDIVFVLNVFDEMYIYCIKS